MPQPDASVAILRAGGPRGSVLLIRRAEREDDPWSGHWSFPGGRREPHDGSAHHTALRELEEECGIQLPADVACTPLPWTPARRRSGNPLLVAPFVFEAASELPARADQTEAVEARWVSLPHLLDPAAHRLGPVPGMPARLLFPVVALEPVPLWGFTYRLIADWLGLAESAFGAACNAVAGALTSGAPPDRLDLPWPAVPSLNCLEIGADSVRVVGARYEERVIPIVRPSPR